MIYLRNLVNVANVKNEPTHDSELHTQVLFGQKVILLEHVNQYWSKILFSVNDKEGFVLSSQFETITQTEFEENNFPILMKTVLDPNLYFMGSLLIHPCSKYTPEILFNGNENHDLLLKFLNIPYLWGGYTHAGIDCSGLSKLFYFFHGVYLPHTASKQMDFGSPVDFLLEAQCGDLAFFYNTDNEINHVGILLSSNEIIHASETNGKVAIDFIDQEGIINKMSNKRTHSLKAIMRYKKFA